MYSFSGKKLRTHSAGFTIIELLITVSIIAVITTVVLVRYVSFDSTVILKNEAYEIALLLRESQAKSVSVYRNTAASDENAAFNYPYGMSFNTSEDVKHSYISFIYRDEDPDVNPRNDIVDGGDPDDSVALQTGFFDLGQSMQIEDLCYVVVDSSLCTGTVRLDISFRRPDFQALFHATNAGPTDIIEMARIKLSATREGAGTGIFVVEVSRLGQISVYRE